jgi:ketosteroid isomerase-like protein
MADNDWVNDLFQAIDKRDTEAFLTFLSDDVFFRFGNAEPAHGKNNVGNVVRGFFNSIKGIQHDINETWSMDGKTVCHGFVTYTRLDDTSLTVPFAVILQTNMDKIHEYLIYADVSQLYQ